MKLAAAVLSLCFTSVAPALAVADAPQTLSIGLSGNGAQATQLPSYDPARPIAVAVTERDAASADAVAVEAVGPAGERLRVPLARSADGRLTGSLRLTDAGSWILRLDTRSGTFTAQTAPVTVFVTSPPPSYAGWIGFAVGSAIFVFVGGTGFALLRRGGQTAPPQELARAA